MVPVYSVFRIIAMTRESINGSSFSPAAAAAHRHSLPRVYIGILILYLMYISYAKYIYHIARRNENCRNSTFATVQVELAMLIFKFQF